MIFFSTCPIDVLLADRGGKGPLEENCLDSDLTCSPLHSVCNTKHILSKRVSMENMASEPIPWCEE